MRGYSPFSFSPFPSTWCVFSVRMLLIHLTCCYSSAGLFQYLPFKCPKKSFCGDNRCQGVLVVLLSLCPHQAVFALHRSLSALLLVICGFRYTNNLCLLSFCQLCHPQMCSHLKSQEAEYQRREKTNPTSKTPKELDSAVSLNNSKELCSFS